MILILGILAPLFIIISSLQSKRETLLIYASIASFCFAFHFLLMQSITAGILNALLGLYTLYSYYFNKSNIKVITLFITFILFITLISFQGILSIISCLGLISLIIARTQPTAQRIRYLLLLSESFWLTHNILINSYPTILGSSIIILINSLALIYYNIKNKRMLKTSFI